MRRAFLFVQHVLVSCGHMLYSDSYVLKLTTAWAARAKIAKLAGSSLCARVSLNHVQNSILN